MGTPAQLDQEAAQALTLRWVDFPEFVARLIKGVFDAVVEATSRLDPCTSA